MLVQVCSLLSILAVVLTAAEDDPRVVINEGPLRGSILTSKGGRQIFSFKGIPFAAPPVGDLKYKNPVAPASWGPEERLAKNDPSSCSQTNFLTKVYEGTEDCLYLNVYSPKLDHEGSGLPVLFWIHGGGFYTGSGNTDLYGPEILMDQDLILVTFNYRLGAQGFLSLGTTEVPGNIGMKDQVMALCWVRENIAKFGGNPDLITAIGESAGGSSVHYLMLSPLSRGLFHRAVALSGSAYNDWAFETNPVRNARELAAKVNCPSNDNAALLTCLKTVDPVKLANETLSVMAALKKDTIFAPVIEPAGTEGAFLMENPRILMSRGDFEDVPVMAGLMTHESIYQLGGLLEKGHSVAEELRLNHERYVPARLGFTPGSSKFEAAWKDVKTFFEEIYPENEYERFVMLVSDAEFVPGVDDFVRDVAALGRNAFYYQFSYDGTFSLLKHLFKITYNGTCHSDELGYMFTGTMYAPYESANPADLLTSQRFCKMISNFARTGNPTPDDSLAVTWQAVEAPLNNPNEAITRYLDIGSDLVMKEENLNEQRVDFWRNLVEKYKSA